MRTQIGASWPDHPFFFGGVWLRGVEPAWLKLTPCPAPEARREIGRCRARDGDEVRRGPLEYKVPHSPDNRAEADRQPCAQRPADAREKPERR
jgi:hypothetical protein